MLENSTKSPSPVVFTIRPLCRVICGSVISVRTFLRAASVPSSSVPMSRL